MGKTVRPTPGKKGLIPHFPTHFYIWICDLDEGQPVYALTENLEDIASDEYVSVYMNMAMAKLGVKRVLVDL